jgi:hypothetical protein
MLQNVSDFSHERHQYLASFYPVVILISKEDLQQTKVSMPSDRYISRAAYVYITQLRFFACNCTARCLAASYVAADPKFQPTLGTRAN